LKGNAISVINKKKEKDFRSSASLARRPKGLSEAMTGEPESKGFLGKAGFEKRETQPIGWVLLLAENRSPGNS